VKYWKQIDLPDWEVAAKKVYDWIVRDTAILKTAYFWNNVDPLLLTRAVAPEIHKGLKATLGVRAVSAHIIVANKSNSDSIHVDNISFTDNLKARLNIPISNCVGSYTIFYSRPDDALKRYIMPNGLIAWLLDPTKCVEATRVEMIKPTIIRICEPHAVKVADNPEPRITLSMRLSEDPVTLLDEEDNANV
jgi:hypothetical protein